MKNVIAKSLLLSTVLSLPAMSSSNDLGDKFQALSHQMVEVDSTRVDTAISAILEAATQKGFTTERLAEAKIFLNDAAGTPYWRFYMVNGGLNGPLTEYMTLFHEDYAPVQKDFFGNPLKEMDRWYFEDSPFILAYQQNHRNCRSLVEAHLEKIRSSEDDPLKLASIACGTMYEFMKIKLPEDKKAELYAYDIDAASVQSALANGKKYSRAVVARQQDAWKDLPDAPFDVITCNGFTFYENDDERLTSLFRNFYNSLNKGGVMISSFILPKDQWKTTDTTAETWRKLGLMMDLIPSKWTAAFRDKDRMKAIAIKAGFDEASIRFEDEPRNIHPSIVAMK
jgi:hypothetical protein